MKGFLAALRFLTVLPVPGRDAGVHPHSAWYFPAVGLLLGLILAGVDRLLIRVLPLPPESACLVLLLVVLTGGLHLDGLADASDGLFSNRPREHALAIMRDSRTGPMGVASVVLILILQTTLLASLTGPGRTGALVLAPLAGRCGMITVMGLLPYARSQGLAAAFRSTRGLAAWGLAWSGLAGWLLLGAWGVAAGIGGWMAALLLAWYYARKIGGYTGDMLGAACEICSLVPLLIAAAGLGIRG